MKKRFLNYSHIAKCLVYVAMLLIGTICNAQQTIKGVVLDADTKQPIPFVNIYLQNTLKGTATNMLGEFSMAIPKDNSNDLLIRALGYKSQVIESRKIFQLKEKICLIPQTYDLVEFEKAEDKALTDPEEIVQKAISRISKNISNERFTLNAEYQDIFQDYLTDSILCTTHKSVQCNFEGINKNEKSDSVQVLSSETDNTTWENFRYNESAVLPQYEIPDYNTNHLQCLLRMDPIRNYQTKTFDFVERLDVNFLANHFLWLDSIGRYNNRNTYFITISLRPQLRYSYVNIVSGNFAISEISIRKSSTTSPHPHFSDHVFLNGYGGYPVSMPIGRLMLDTKDLAIVYFEYCNGFGNDRYKFSAEYIKYGEKYYPSKMYFANKFWMSPKPNFKIDGNNTKNGLQCLYGPKYYNGVLKEFSTSQEQKKVVIQTIAEHTIECPISSYRSNDNKINVPEIIAKNKAAEEILMQTKYKDFTKYIHHRKVVFQPPSSAGVTKTSDYDNFFYALGDRSFHWYAFGSKRMKDRKTGTIWTTSAYRMTCDKFNVGIPTYIHSGDELDSIFPIIALPVTSIDEYRYVLKYPENNKIHTRPNLVKGYLFIRKPQ